MKLSRENAVRMLVSLFEENKLSFRNMQQLKEVFDEAIETCDEIRSEAIADWKMGRSAKPNLADQDTENDFYYNMQVKAEDTFAKSGIKASSRAIKVVVDFAIDEADYDQKDFFILD